MKILLYLIFCLLEVNYYELKLQSQIDLYNSGLSDDLSNIESVLKKINNVDKYTNKSDNFKKLRFKESRKGSENEQASSKILDSIMNKNENGNEVDTSDSLDINLNINEDPIFDINDGSKDKELQRKEGLKNGNILYNNKRTLNVETSEFADFYYEIIKTV